MRYRTNCDRDNDRGSVKKTGIAYMGIQAAYWRQICLNE